jgi:hypothetical protein
MKEPQNILRSRESVKKAIAAAPAWHSSVAGLAWHTERGKRNAIVRQSKEYKCEKCGKLFDSKYPAKYCSNACKTAARAASGIDDVQRQCEHCGGTFTVNKYSGQRFCGRPCARVARWAKK